MSFKEELVLDARGHMLGRLATNVAKSLLNGQKVTLVRCESINISGSLFRNQLKYKAFKRLTNNVRPWHGPYHYRCPSKIFWRTVRGMMPHKTARGAAALDRLKAFDGVPHPYDTKKKNVCPEALKVLCLKPHRKYCVLGDLSEKFGWKAGGLVGKLEDQRRTRAGAYFKRKLATAKKVGGVKKSAAKALKGDEKALYEKTVC